MYPAWSWGGTTTAAASGSPTAASFVQPTSAGTGQPAASQWPANYNQYAAVTPEMQQQWAAAWASQAQFAYTGSVPVAGQVPTTGAYAGLTEAQPQTTENSQTEKPKITLDEAQIDQEEEDFERQFKDWEKQFQTWKDQNINHPDKEAFAQYEKQWQEWRAQLLQKKEQMQKAKAERLAAKMAQQSTMPSQADEEFDRHFREWEKQFETWKEQNIHHLDKEAFAQYEKQWHEWRAQLLQKKEQMQKANADHAKMPRQAGADATAVDPNAAANSMYYQQYMYMQPPYIYPGGAATDAPQQYPYGADGYGGQPTTGSAPMGARDPNMNSKEQEHDQYNYGQPGENYPNQGGSYQNYDEYGSPAMYPPEGDEQYQREMNFGRNRAGRGRAARGRGGRGRGRGRWQSDPNEMENQPPPDMRGPGPALLDNPEFPPQGPGNFHDDERDYPGGFPPDGRNFQGPRDFQGPRGPRDFPPDEFHDGDMPFPERGRGRNFNGRFPPGGKQPLLPRDADGQPPIMSDRPPPIEQQSSRYPPDEFEEPYPPFEDGFPPDSDRFPPPPPRSKNGRFMMDRDFDGFPPMDDPFGPPPPFRDDFPPFDDRFPPGRGGRFAHRGRRFPPGGRGDFDRFGPPFPPDDPYDDRFPFDGPPRMPRGRGMRPPFDPDFGPGRFPDDPYFADGPPPPPMRFKSIDYTHRPADDFDPHYDYESEFQDDVVQFRAKGGKRNKRPAPKKEPEELAKEKKACE